MASFFNKIPVTKTIDNPPIDLKIPQEQVPVLPTYIKKEYEWTYGAGAVSKDIPLAKAPIAAIILNMGCLGAGGAATLANMLTQFGTYMYVKDGGDIVTPRWSATELAEYHKAALGTDTPFQDGTAADNKFALGQIVMLMGRPVYRPVFPAALIDPSVAFKPSNTPYLHVEAPADANSIDNRVLKVTVVYHPLSEQVPYDKRWTEWSNQTVSTTSVTDWGIGTSGLWSEYMIYQTSAYNDTLTGDAPSILKVEVERKNGDLVFQGELPNILGCCLDTDVAAEDSYLYGAFTYRGENLGMNPTILDETKFRVTGGVADAVLAAFAVIKRK